MSALRVSVDSAQSELHAVHLSIFCVRNYVRCRGFFVRKHCSRCFQQTRKLETGI